jgi:glycosyltransferase involved in cell wall biosynthesis
LTLLKNVDRVITTNNNIKKEFVANGFKGERILVASHGVNFEMFGIDDDKDEAIRKIQIEDNLKNKMSKGKVLLYTGSFFTTGVEKGIDEILKAMNILKDDNIVFFAVGGNENDIVYYKKISQDLRLDNAYFISRRNQTELALWQRAADILLMPFPDKIHYTFFMAPIKMFEYMAAEKSIIASNLPSVKEILNEENCIFCKPGDAEDLAEKIRLLLSNKQLGNKIAKQARKDVKQKTWGARAKLIIDFIK